MAVDEKEAVMSKLMEWGTKWRFIVWFSFTLRIGCEGVVFLFCAVWLEWNVVIWMGMRVEILNESLLFRYRFLPHLMFFYFISTISPSPSW